MWEGTTRETVKCKDCGNVSILEENNLVSPKWGGEWYECSECGSEELDPIEEVPVVDSGE